MGLPGFLKKLFGKGDEGSAPSPAAAPAPAMPGATPEVPPASTPPAEVVGAVQASAPAEKTA